MKTVDQHREEFEAFYQTLNLIRRGAYGIASKHLDQHNGDYISEHAQMAWLYWFQSASVNEK